MPQKPLAAALADGPSRRSEGWPAHEQRAAVVRRVLVGRLLRRLEPERVVCRRNPQGIGYRRKARTMLWGFALR
jgi:hypothetical protein